MTTLPSSLPGPRGYWLLGSVPPFRRDMLGFLTRCAREHGDMASFRLGPRPHVLVSHPELIYQILVTENANFVKPYNYQFLRPSVGNGLLLNEGKSWLRQRRLIQPHFLRQRLLGYAPAAVELTRKFCSGWKDGERRDAHTDMTRLTLNIIAQAVLGADVAGQAEVVERCLEIILHDFKFRLETGLDLPRWLPTPGNCRLRRAVVALGQVISGMIAERRARPEKHDDLLSRLVQAHQDGDGAMSEQQMRDEVSTMLLAGHETTANTLAWTLALLGKHPKIEEEVVGEICQVFPNGVPDADGLDRLHLTEQVLLESMRLYPTAYLIGRQTANDTVLGGFPIPAGLTLFISQWVVHRDPRFFEQPEEFHPARWTDGPRSLPERAYFPFGAGPRVCIGNHFAMLEAQLILATMLPRFRLQPVHPQLPTPWPSVTLRPKEGLPVILQQRVRITRAGSADQPAW